MLIIKPNSAYLGWRWIYLSPMPNNVNSIALFASPGREALTALHFIPWTPKSADCIAHFARRPKSVGSIALLPPAAEKRRQRYNKLPGKPKSVDSTTIFAHPPHPRQKTADNTTLFATLAPEGTWQGI